MTNQHQTPEQALEILAREMSVEDALSRGTDLPASQHRARWYDPQFQPGNDRWRTRAAALMETLGRSDLELTWRES